MTNDLTTFSTYTKYKNQISETCIEITKIFDLSFQGTPFTCKVYDGKLVSVSGGSSARVGVPVQLAVDAAQAGEGNLEITVAARGLNIPTQVHPQVSSYISVIINNL